MNAPAHAPDPLRELTGESGTGCLVDGWPRVAELLAGASPAALRRAGARLSTIDTDAVLAAHPGTTDVPVTLTGSSTTAPLAPPLAAEIARHGLLPRITVGDPGGWAVALAAEPAPGLTVCLLDDSVVFDRLAGPVWTVDDVASASAEVRAQLATAARRHDGRGTGLVLTTPPLTHDRAGQVLDLRERARLGAVWRRFTADLLDLGGPDGTDGVHVVDTDPIALETGPARDPRLVRYAHVAFTDEWLAVLARRIGHLARARHGRPRKCLVLDLDGTLWGGTLAESGPDGLDMAEGFRGEAHRAFQRAVAVLGHQGVLLAVCSKNDPGEVAAVLADHPDLVVRAADLTAVEAGWGPKPEAVARIADRIGIGVDALVFVDDNPSETGSVRAAHPGVVTVDVDAADPAGHVGALLADGWFDVPTLTEDDRERAGRYRTETRRAAFRDTTGSVEDYLAGLDTRLQVLPAGRAEVARLAQLANRTNQFNLTTRRLDEPAVRALLDDPAALPVAVRVTDRFGDHGLVGAAFCSWRGTDLHVDNLVLSCRVLGRGVESAWIGALLRHAAAAGADSVVAGYRASPRNDRVRTLWPDHGFVAAPAPSSPGAGQVYRHSLTDLPPYPPYVSVQSSLPDVPAPVTPGGVPR
ncbi:HAD-IIIC family phosphatase [Pseudonocardia alni]|uniref:HAD-IIIC family phosphatase n=1 Tax=Pseudonocardia alni TaxID=33907 RepID=UPI0036B617DA